MERVSAIVMFLTKEISQGTFDYISFVVIMLGLLLAFLIAYRISKKYKIYSKRDETDNKDETVQVQNL